MSKKISEKLNAAKIYFESFADQKVVVAFSGGADSLLVLALLKEVTQNPDNISAVYFNTCWMSRLALQEAQESARLLGVSLHQVKTEGMDAVGIGANPINRCYLCKKHLFDKLWNFARSVGANVVMEGTQLDDLTRYRPGQKAITESGAISPLRELGLHKQDVRELLAELGIAAANRPSGSCLATRFPYGTRLTEKKLQAVEKAECYLKTLGFYNLRVRSDGPTARIEVDKPYFSAVITHAHDIVNKLKNLGWQYVTLDLQGFRSGSMDETNSANR